MLDLKRYRVLGLITNSGRYPELVFLTEVFSNSTDLALVIPNSTVKRKLFYSKTSWKRYHAEIHFHPVHRVNA